MVEEITDDEDQWRRVVFLLGGAEILDIKKIP